MNVKDLGPDQRDEDGECTTCGSDEIENIPIYENGDSEFPWGFACYCNGCSKGWTEDEHGYVFKTSIKLGVNLEKGEK